MVALALALTPWLLIICNGCVMCIETKIMSTYPLLTVITSFQVLHGSEKLELCLFIHFMVYYCLNYIKLGSDTQHKIVILT